MITLTNGVQIPENAVQLQTTAAIDGYYVTQPLRLVQYDETLPVAAVQLTYQNQPYTPPTGAELNVRMGKPDGTTVYNPCLGMDSSGIVYFAFTQQMTIVAGTGTLTVEITDSGVKNSAPIIAEIRPNPVPEGSIESADEFLTLQEILAEAEKWGQIVQTNAANIQQVVDNLEDIQNAAENAQAAAESAAAAQQAAQEALGFRKFYSAVVPDSNGNLDPSRPMTVGPAASVEIESAGDRIQSVTALGFTQQAGTGDPSPTNVRAITNGGKYFNVTVYTGQESWSAYSGKANTFSVPAGTTIYGGVSSYYAGLAAGEVGTKNGIYLSNTLSVIVTDLACSSADEFKAKLQALYTAGTPLKVWYNKLVNGAEEKWEPGKTLYAPIILTSGEYRATCLPLTAPLCDGDSVVSWAENADGDAESIETHAQSVVVADGSTTALTQGSGGYTLALPGAANGAVKCDTFSNLTASGGSVTIPTSQFPPSVTSLETANQWLQSNNVTVVYPLAAPAVYTHDPVALEAATGDQLTYTVTGQSGGTVSVTLKPFQDGGHAKTADSATTAQNATQFDGHTWDEVPGQAPVQSVNSQTGAVTLGAADVGAVPLNHTAVLADGIALKDGSPVNTPADIDQYTVLRIYSNYGTAVCPVPADSGNTSPLPFISGSTAPYINIAVATISRSDGQLSLSTAAILRLTPSGITSPGTALSVYRIEGLV